jgi:hypothetical protein
MEIFMESPMGTTVVAQQANTGVAWDAVAAGAVAAAAFTILLVAFGAGLGFSAISPWSDSGLSAGGFRTATGIYLVLISIMASAIGGYLAARLRTRFVGLHDNEVYFRDSAHGFIAWAFATVLTATALAAALTHIANGAAAGLTATAGSQSANPQEVYVDRLFRPANAGAPNAGAQATPGAAPAAPAAAPGAAAPAQAPAAPQNAQNGRAARAEVLRLWTADFARNKELTPDDRAYVAQLVAAQTGLSQADAQKRVDQVVTQEKEALDQARRGAAKLSFWLTAALLFGAFAAALAAVEGGMLRDGEWNDRVLVPRTI